MTKGGGGGGGGELCGRPGQQNARGRKGIFEVKEKISFAQRILNYRST